MSVAAALREAIERLGFLERRQVLALEVLDQCELDDLGVVDIADDDRQLPQPDLDRRLIAALAGHDLEPLPALRILGVVITMHDKRTALARDIRTQIQKVFGGKVFKTVITKSVRLEESPAYKESIFTFAPDSTGATEYYRLCEEVIDRA